MELLHISDLPSLPALSGVSQFSFASPGLPVNKSKSPGYHKLVKSPGFYTFISRFFFAIRLLSCIPPTFSYRKTLTESPVIRYRFLFTSNGKFRRWNHFQNSIEKCTWNLSNLYEEISSDRNLPLFKPFIYIRTVEQCKPCFRLQSSCLKTPSFWWNPKSISRFGNVWLEGLIYVFEFCPNAAKN